MADRGVWGNRTQNAGLFDVDSAFIYSAVTNNPTTTSRSSASAPWLCSSSSLHSCSRNPREKTQTQPSVNSTAVAGSHLLACGETNRKMHNDPTFMGAQPLSKVTPSRWGWSAAGVCHHPLQVWPPTRPKGACKLVLRTLTHTYTHKHGNEGQQHQTNTPSWDRQTKTEQHINTSP